MKQQRHETEKGEILENSTKERKEAVIGRKGINTNRYEESEGLLHCYIPT
jgi:hypothetical protein